MKSIKLFARYCAVFLALFGMSFTTFSAPTPSEYGVVLNLSGKQRMLSQKMSKEVTLIALGVDVDKNVNNLKQTSALFDKTLKGLSDGDASLGLPPTDSKRILRQLDKVSEIWDGFYPTVQAIVSSKAVSPEQMQLIADNNLPLLKQMNKAVGLYEKDAKKNGLKASPELAVTLNLSGKQRMLTQKMSKEFFLIALGINTDDNKLNLLETYSLFDQTLQGLKDGDQTLDLTATKSPQIRKQLDVVKNLWQDFKPLVEEGSSDKTVSISPDSLQKVAQKNLPLLKEMNGAVMLYEAEAKQ